MDISAVVLSKLIESQSLEVWAKLKLAFLDPAFANLYGALNRHYDKYSVIPTFDELKAVLREGPTLQTLASVELALDADIDINVAMDALLDQYTQSETVRMLDKFIDKLPVYDSAEIKENLSAIVLYLDEKTLATEGVFNMAELMLFERPEELAKNRVHLGFNNTFDAMLGGAARQELILIGGESGSGKSVICSNIFVSQYEAGNTSAYFTIEMRAQETNQRDMAILSGVDAQHIKFGTLSDSELMALVQARANMFQDAQPAIDEYLQHRDRYKFESTLSKEYMLKEDNQMIIIDDRALSLSSLDLHLGKIKSKFGDKFTVAVVDYLNQIVLEGTSGTQHSQFEWKDQVIVSKKLKELARKYDIVMISPYQIDKTGAARFAKGILDAADIALLMKAHDKDTGAVSFESTKLRGARELEFTSGINWDTLRISPVPIDKPAAKEVVKDNLKRAGKKNKDETQPTGEPAADVPW